MASKIRIRLKGDRKKVNTENWKNRLSLEPLVIGITMGDPAGVGPELCLRVLRSRRLAATCARVVFGDAALLSRVARLTGVPFQCPVISWSQWHRCVLPCRSAVVDCGAINAERVRPGVISAACGRAAAVYVEAAVEAAMTGRVVGIVTGPIHKEAWRRAGIQYAGHTEMLATLTGAKKVCMMLASDEIKVSLVTIHTALAEVPGGITCRRILEVIELTAAALRRLGIKRPRLAVCGLNPHAGEGGLFGHEEHTAILPAVRAARRRGILVAGPLPPDTACLPEKRAVFDAFVAMYHDQGLIPFKMLAFDRGVNITLGLPIIRTSVDHGTAFDIAWRGTASAASLTQGVLWAARLARNGGGD